MAEMTAGRTILEMLRAEGIDHTFGIVGTTTNSIITEMYGRSDIRFIDSRHEEGAAFMAYGYARASGKPTACITTSGPGSINLEVGRAISMGQGRRRLQGVTCSASRCGPRDREKSESSRSQCSHREPFSALGLGGEDELARLDG